jgi:8-oxo-dGTP pyrophosphatase MutT (NUDIX family)
MPNRFVFPGGKVEPEDGAEPLADQTLRNCALRELWEEAGVILASDAAAAAAADETAKTKALASLEAGRTSLGQAMAGLGLEPDVAGLKPYNRWITPKARPKRFDTTFYLALMPQGQKAACDHKETSEGLWLGPARALAENQAGNVELAPPQVRLLGELATHASLDGLLESVRRPSLSPVEPFLWINGKERVIMLPWDPDYETREPVTKARPCPAHQCSRLVHDRGRWLPYGV